MELSARAISSVQSVRTIRSVQSVRALSGLTHHREWDVRPGRGLRARAAGAGRR